MPSLSCPSEVASFLLAQKGLQLQSLDVVQSLWADYGQICHLTAVTDTTCELSELAPSVDVSSVPEERQSLILKIITPPPAHASNEGHGRKILSYQVEQYFYSQLASQLPASVPVPTCLASVNQRHVDGTLTIAMIMNDVRQEYPIAGDKRKALSSIQVNAALDWLSGFHGFWWPRVKEMDRQSLVLPPLEEVKHEDSSRRHRRREKTVWLNGGYTYLATRRTEYADLANDYNTEWNEPLTDCIDGQEVSISEVVASFLAPKVSGRAPSAEYQTLLHGDVKSENLFTNESGEKVVFYDFQYTGLGLGVCDIAKFFTCSVPLAMLVAGQHTPLPRELEMQDEERALLQRYWKRLKDVGKQEYPWHLFVQHWHTALVDWLRFQASWGFWGNTEWLEARVRSILKDKEWRDCLA